MSRFTPVIVLPPLAKTADPAGRVDTEEKLPLLADQLPPSVFDNWAERAGPDSRRIPAGTEAEERSLSFVIIGLSRETWIPEAAIRKEPRCAGRVRHP